MWKITNGYGQVTAFEYEAATERLFKKINHNGTFDQTTYDNKGRVSTMHTRKTAGGTDPFQRTYSYDAAGRVVSLLDNYNGTGPVNTGYTYDDRGQLKSEARLGWFVAYTYDPNGNRATRTKNAVLETYVNDPADKLTSMSDSNGFSRTFTYDLAGRMLTDVRQYLANPVDSRVYTWNHGGRLVNQTSTLTSQNLAHGYNAAGARVSSTPAGQTPTLYKRAGMGVLAPILSEKKDGTTLVAYTPGISEKRGPSSTWVHGGTKSYDYQSSSAGNPLSARRYDAFGDG